MCFLTWNLLRVQPRAWTHHPVRLRRSVRIDHTLTLTIQSSETLHPILQSRVGPDQFVSRILRLREDPRFRSVGPNVLEMVDDSEIVDNLGEEEGLWFDYTFVEFLKTNYSQ